MQSLVRLNAQRPFTNYVILHEQLETRTSSRSLIEHYKGSNILEAYDRSLPEDILKTANR